MAFAAATAQPPIRALNGPRTAYDSFLKVPQDDGAPMRARSSPAAAETRVAVLA